MFERELELIKGASIKEKFVYLLYAGEKLAEAAGQIGVNPAVIGVEMLNDPDFEKAVRSAQGFRSEIAVDKLENIQDYEDDAVMAGVISKNIQWLASKRKRDVYGDKVDHNLNVNISISAAMEEAKHRTLEHIGVKPLDNKHSSTDILSVKQPVIDLEPVEDDPLS